MPPLPVHVCVSDSHRALAERHLIPTFDQTAGGAASLVLHEVPQHCASGRFREAGWVELTREKVQVALQASMATADGDPFAVCDADVAFLAPWAEPALDALAGRDLVAMAEPGFSPAFWAARAGPPVRKMLTALLGAWGTWRGDGEALAHGLQAHRLNAALLDARFANPGILGHPIPLALGSATFTPPAETLLFHANFCTLPDKDVLLTEVRRLMGGGQRSPNDELVAPGPEGRGFFPATRPDRPFDRHTTLSRDRARQVLAGVGDRPVRLIAEIGSGLGASTRWLLETFADPRAEGASPDGARIVCIDPWEGASEAVAGTVDARAGTAWEQFAANCWHLRQWIVPFRLPVDEGLAVVSAALERRGQAPDIVYFNDTDPRVFSDDDVRAAADAWPEAIILGAGVQRPPKGGRPRSRPQSGPQVTPLGDGL